MVRAVHACAADSAWALGDVDPRITRALAIARRWADGERFSPSEVNVAASEVYAARDELRTAALGGLAPEAAKGHALAVSAIYTLELVRQPEGTDLGPNAAKAVSAAGRAVALRSADGRASADAVALACRSKAPTVRAVLSLSDVLLARAAAGVLGAPVTDVPRR